MIQFTSCGVAQRLLSVRLQILIESTYTHAKIDASYLTHLTQLQDVHSPLPAFVLGDECLICAETRCKFTLCQASFNSYAAQQNEQLLLLIEADILFHRARYMKILIDMRKSH